MSALDRFEGLIRQKVESDRATHAQISAELLAMFPGERGFSVWNVKRFCQERNIHKTSRLPEAEVESAVQAAVQKVHHTRIAFVYCNYNRIEIGSSYLCQVVLFETAY